MTYVSKNLIREIAELSQNYGIGIFSTASPSARTIFVGDIPATVTQGVWLVEVPSPPPHNYIDTEYTVIDFWARSPNTEQAHALLELVYNSFHRRYDYRTLNWHIRFSRSLGSIVDASRDEEGGKLLRLSIQFICRNLNNLS